MSENWISPSTQLPELSQQVIVSVYYSDAVDIWDEHPRAVALENNDVIVSFEAYYTTNGWAMDEYGHETIGGLVTCWKAFPMPCLDRPKIIP